MNTGLGNLAGRTYFERGKPVTVLRSWGPGGGMRNVLVQRDDGTLVVRPFRGLRKQGPSCPPTTSPSEGK